jgi:hypothetical protein
LTMQSAAARAPRSNTQQHSALARADWRAAAAAHTFDSHFKTNFNTQRQGGQLETALQLLEELRAAALTPDAFTYGSALDASARCGDWRQAQALAGDMAAAGVAPNVFCYRWAAPCCGGGQRLCLEPAAALHLTAML